MESTYMLSVTAAYTPGCGSPETLVSALDSAMFDHDYSLQLREHGPQDDGVRTYVGLCTLYEEDAEDVRGPLVAAVVDTAPDWWGVMMREVHLDDVRDSDILWEEHES